MDGHSALETQAFLCPTLVLCMVTIVSSQREARVILKENVRVIVDGLKSLSAEFSGRIRREMLTLKPTKLRDLLTTYLSPILLRVGESSHNYEFGFKSLLLRAG